MKKRIAINGFGRIGRAAARLVIAHPDLELIAINDPSPIEQMAHLFQFDTNYGRFEGTVSIEKNNTLQINKQKVQCFSSREINTLPWKELKIDIVMECTGVFCSAEDCNKHIAQGAKKVILSAPAKSDGFATIVIGANEGILTGKETLVSNASCTTNCLAPVAKVIHDTFEIESGLMTTTHAYTNDQRILDVGHKDLRRARAAAENVIPTSTGAAKAVGLVLPELKGKLNGLAIRIPVPTVSLVDLVVKVRKPATVETVNAALKKAAEKNPHILGFEERPLVSSDFIKDTRSSIVDAAETMVMGDLVKVIAWYDNEWGYSCRFVELTAML